MTLQKNASLKVCNWCGQSENEVKFQKAQKAMCSPCRQGIPKEIVETTPVYYTYLHVCPYSNDIVYVGKGVNYRALAAWGSGGRDPDHAKWLHERLVEGNNPYQLCQIHDYGMPADQAETKEATLKQKFKEAGHSLKFCKDIK